MDGVKWGKTDKICHEMSFWHIYLVECLFLHFLLTCHVNINIDNIYSIGTEVQFISRNVFPNLNVQFK